MASATLTRDTDWRKALDTALAETDTAAKSDLVLFFASPEYMEHFEEMVPEVRRVTGAAALAGCSGQGIIGPEREIEGEPGLSLLRLQLPGATLTPVYLTQGTLGTLETPEAWYQQTGVARDDVNSWLLFVDPFRIDVEALMNGLSEAYPESPLIGGLASGSMRRQGTHVFFNDDVYQQGAVLVAIGGAYTVQTVVSQGCDPIGEAWIITGAEGNVIRQISQRPAYEVLVETLRALPPDVRERASRNLLVGLAMDEYKESFGRGDFLIRNLSGVDPDSGAVAIGAYPKVGQTVQFQIRDARAADEDLTRLLAKAREELGDTTPAGAVLCSCNGRGVGLFGSPDHDARSVAQQLGSVPLAGFFCNGEIGPVGGKNFLHGFTASLALFVRK
jgi:small ligand-binding sensory domain FIST